MEGRWHGMACPGKWNEGGKWLVYSYYTVLPCVGCRILRSIVRVHWIFHGHPGLAILYSTDLSFPTSAMSSSVTAFTVPAVLLHRASAVSREFWNNKNGTEVLRYCYTSYTSKQRQEGTGRKEHTALHLAGLFVRSRWCDKWTESDFRKAALPPALIYDGRTGQIEGVELEKRRAPKLNFSVTPPRWTEARDKVHTPDMLKNRGDMQTHRRHY